jgi:hypothetical protein
VGCCRDARRVCTLRPVLHLFLVGERLKICVIFAGSGARFGDLRDLIYKTKPRLEHEN